MQDRSIDLPKSIALEDKKYDGDLSLSAKESISAKGLYVKGTFCRTVGLSTVAESKEIESLVDKTSEIIKKNFFNNYSSSTKLILRIGKNGTCVTYTPDIDGVARDETECVRGNETNVSLS